MVLKKTNNNIVAGWNFLVVYMNTIKLYVIEGLM